MKKKLFLYPTISCFQIILLMIFMCGITYSTQISLCPPDCPTTQFPETGLPIKEDQAQIKKENESYVTHYELKNIIYTWFSYLKGGNYYHDYISSKNPDQVIVAWARPLPLLTLDSVKSDLNPFVLVESHINKMGTSYLGMKVDSNKVDTDKLINTLNEQVSKLNDQVATLKTQNSMLTTHLENILTTLKTDKKFAKELASKEKIAVKK